MPNRKGLIELVSWCCSAVVGSRSRPLKHIAAEGGAALVRGSRPLTTPPVGGGEPTLTEARRAQQRPRCQVAHLPWAARAFPRHPSGQGSQDGHGAVVSPSQSVHQIHDSGPGGGFPSLWDWRPKMDGRELVFLVELSVP